MFNNFVFLGEGKNGQVYLMPNGKVIKYYKKLKNCLDECAILRKVNGNKHFPKIYECTSTYMIRDYVGGQSLPDYIEQHGLSKRLAANLIYLVEDFIKLGFTRLDIRCEHIYVQKDESIIIIDPRAHFTKIVPYPRQMTAGLKALDVLEIFLTELKNKRPDLYTEWKGYFK